MVRTYCDVDECLEEAKSKGKCWAHAKQAQRGNGLRPVKKRRSIVALVVESAITLAEADPAEHADEDFYRALRRHQYITARWHGIPASDLHGRRKFRRKRALQDA